MMLLQEEARSTPLQRRVYRYAVLLLVGLLSYWGYEAARALAARHGGLVVHAAPMLGLEVAVFGQPLALEMARLQNAALNLVMALVYAVHPVYYLALMVYALRRSLRLYYRLLIGLAASSLVAVLLYTVYPTAPPWIAVPGISRLPNPLVALASRLGGGGVDPNPYAAFPSMHVTLAVVAALSLAGEGLGGRWLLLWPLAMSFATLYTGNHYLADIAAGWLLGAAASLLASRATGRLLARVLGGEAFRPRGPRRARGG